MNEDKMPGISIIIPSYNGRALLAENLPHILRECGAYPGPTELIVVDDGGSDDTGELLKRDFPAVKPLRLPVNGGFSRAVNSGARAAAHPLIFLLNNDVRVTPGALAALSSGFSSPDVFAVQARMVSDPAATEADYVGRVASVWGILKYQYRRETLGAVPVAADLVSAGAAMFDRDKFLALGALDEAFSPFYFEDLDLSIRARKVNWRLLYHPGAVVLHLHAGSTVRSNYSEFRYKFIHRRNYFLFLFRYSAPLSLPLLAPYALFRTFSGGPAELAGFFGALWRAARLVFSPASGVKGNVLYLDAPLERPGGGQLSLLNILKSLGGRRPYVILSRESEIMGELRALGIPHLIARPRKLFFLAFCLEAWRGLSLTRPEIVHCNTGTCFFAFVFAVLARLRGIPFIWHNRVLETAGVKDRILAALADRVVVISDAVGEKFKRLAPSKVIKLENAVDVEEFRPAPPSAQFRNELGLPAGRPLVGVFSRLEKWKGHELFFAAVKKLSSAGFAPAVMVTGAGPERARLEELVRALGLQDSVRFLGHRTDIPALMSLCSAVVNPSIAPEPFGRTIIEAMACGKPVIATAMGGPLEIIEDGVDGLLSAPTEEGLAAALAKVLGDSGFAAGLGAAARKKAESRFDLKRQAAALEKIYSELERSAARS